VIVGQWGENQLWGGDGADRFVSGGSPGLETVHDFAVGLDKVEVRAQGRKVDLVWDVTARATLISLDGIGTIVRLLDAEASREDLIIV
jgi:Ca2+-binding RTX toxin-like protein